MDEESMENMLQPRNYQEDLIRVAVKKNTIIYLPTGSGKTFIALCVAKELAGEHFDKKYEDGGKITILTANTVQLVNQHHKYFKQYSGFTKVNAYTGDMNVDSWNAETWSKELNSSNIVVMTPQIIVNCLGAKFIDLNKVNLLILDECHRAVDSHPMRQIMLFFKHLKEQPRVLGLTATLLNGNAKDNEVLKEVQNLEISLHSKVATVDDLFSVLSFSTNPKEQIISYTDTDEHPVITQVNNMLKDHEVLLKAIKVNPSQQTAKELLLDYKLLKKEKAYEKYYRILLDAQENFKMLGVPGARIACQVLTIHLEYERRCCVDKKSMLIIGGLVTLFMKIQCTLDKVYFSLPQATRCLSLCTSKVRTLVQILNSHSKESKEELCGIIFVKRKNTAVFLHHLLKELAETYDNLRHITTDFIFGFTANPLNCSVESLYQSKICKKVIEKFNSKEINLLIASDVIEEGIDIPKCTLVIKFDTPTNYREYVQSKGRARFSSSLFIVMVSNVQEGQFYKKYRKYRAIEQSLNEYLVGQNDNRCMPSQRHIDEIYKENKCYYVNGPDSPSVSMLTAIQLLMMYCSSFKADMYTRYEPIWYLTETDDNQCQVYIQLPLISPLDILIKGDICATKKDAKRSAAFNACVQLHKCGELTDDLLPKCNDEPDPALTQHLFDHWPADGEKIDGVTNKKRPYPKYVPTSLSKPIATQVHLHIIDLKPLFSANSFEIDVQAMIDNYTNDLCFGLITSGPVPNICQFPLFVSAGQINVDFLINQNEITLDEDQLLQIKSFHHVVFKDILNIAQTYLTLGDSDEYLIKHAYIVPVDKKTRKVDFSVLKDHQTIEEQTLEPSLEKKQNLIVDDDSYLGKIVTPYYRDENTQYLVLEVCKTLTANSPFPNDAFSSYAAYFHSKYNKCTMNPQLPLLLVKALSTKMNYLQPRGIASKRHHDELYQEMRIHLIPEMCIKQEFPSSLWIMAKLLPSILHRVVQLIRAEHLRKEIAQNCDLDNYDDDNKVQPLLMNMNLLKYAIVEESESTQKSLSPEEDKEIAEEIDAMQLLSINRVVSDAMDNLQYPWDPSNEPVDIKRNLDVTSLDLDNYAHFLKKRHPKKTNFNDSSMSYPNPKHLAIGYIAPDYVYKSIKLLEVRKGNSPGPQLSAIYESLCTAKSKDIVNLERLETLGDSVLKLVASLYVFVKYPKFTEGQATSLKGRLVSNRNLFYLAQQKKLHEFVKMNELKPNNEWLPIGYCVPKPAYDMIQNKKMPISSLFHIDISYEEQISGCLKNQTLEAIKGEAFEVADLEEDNSYASMCTFLGLQMIGDKSLADVTESLIGSYFESMGIEGGITLIEWLGIIPRSERLPELLKRPPDNPIVNLKMTAMNIDITAMLPISSANEIESILDYKFRNRAFLLQALTHTSYTTNTLTRSYQRLEFIGDAVLDFLITAFIYENYKSLGPGELTDLRSALVNNETFAAYVVNLGLHNYLKHFSSTLMYNISKFATYQSLKNGAISSDVLILLDEDDLKVAEHIDCPKVLGDLFESITGAIYLDSGRDLEQVWRVIHKIMWKEIEDFAKNIPKNPIRLLTELLAPTKPKFAEPTQLSTDSVLAKLDFVFNGKWIRVHGFGDSHRSAKKAAAKIALRLLHISKS